MLAGNDRAAARDLAAHEFRRDEFGDLGPEALAVGDASPRRPPPPARAPDSRDGDVDHLLGDDPGAGELVLRDELAGLAGAQRPRRRAERREAVGGDVAVVLRLDRPALDGGVAARGDPRLADRLQARVEVDARVALRVGARRIVDAHRRLVRIGERDLAEGHAKVRAFLGRGVDLARSLDRPRRHGLGRGELG